MSAGVEGISVAERLGYGRGDRLLIIHADDAGMCHSANAATIRAMEEGVVTSASIMMPCPAVPEMAEYCRTHPDADFGIHLTLNSEWNTYRWKPLSPPGNAHGLLDSKGFMHASPFDVAFRARPAEVEMEIRAQIERALELGIKPTHVDSHMGTLFAGPFYPVYTRVAKEYGLPPMVPGPTPERIRQGKLIGVDVESSHRTLSQAGYVFLDALHESASGSTLESRRRHYEALIRNLQPGLTEIIVHLSLDDNEIRSITGSWMLRWYEYQIVTDPRTRDLIDSLGIRLIGFREVQRVAFQG